MLAGKRFLIFAHTIAFLLVSAFCPGQVSHPEWRSGKNKPGTVRELIDLSRQQELRQQGDRAVHTLLSALQLCSSTGNEKGADTVLKILEQYNQASGNHSYMDTQSIKRVITSLQSFPQKKFWQARYYYMLASHYNGNSHYIKRLILLDKALNILTPEKSRYALELRGKIYTYQYNTWVELSDKVKALESIRKAERIAEQTQDVHLQMNLLQFKGILFFKNKAYDSAQYYLSASYHMLRAYPHKHPEHCRCKFYTVSNLALTLLKNQEPDKALSLIMEEKDALDKENRGAEKKQSGREAPDNREVYLDYLRAYAHFEKKNYRQTEAILLPLQQLAEEEAPTDNSLYINIQELLSMLYDSTGRYREAYVHKARVAQWADNNNRAEEKTQVINMYYELEKEKALAGKKEVIAQQKRQIREKNQLIAGSLAGALLLGTSLLAVYRSSRHKRKLQAASLANLQQQQEITQLQARIEGEEQERSRIARELHDGIVSQLLSLKLNVNALQNKTGQSIEPYELNEVALQLREATEDLRHTAHNLMPELLLQRGLVLSLATLCEKVAKSTQLEIDFQALGQIPRLAQEAELALYRMVQELIQNALKHAEASQILVQLGYMDELLSITVEDNGKGIPPMAVQPGSEGAGLRNLRRRVQLFNGHLDIQSKQGKKTTVYLEFPLKDLA